MLCAVIFLTGEWGSPGKYVAHGPTDPLACSSITTRSSSATSVCARCPWLMSRNIYHQKQWNFFYFKIKASMTLILTLLTLLIASGMSATQAQSIDGQNQYELSGLEWKLWGYSPESWKYRPFNPDIRKQAEIQGIPSSVPGSVQRALKNGLILKDWNIGLNHRDCEWVENLNWIFSTQIPNEWVKDKKVVRLVCRGLDDNGVVLVNGKEAGQFNNAFIPYSFDISALLQGTNNILEIIFGLPPRYIGSPSYTSKIKDWKPRFYYSWDWMPRNVQIGIWDNVIIETSPENYVKINDLKIFASADRAEDLGELKLKGEMSPIARRGNLAVQLKDESGHAVIDETVPCSQISSGKVWSNLKIKRWWPNGEGEQKLYQLHCVLYDDTGGRREEITRRVGFKNIAWEANPGAPLGADPWLCVVNNRPVFLQGVNWTPIRPNFADLREPDYRKLVTLYRDLGINVFRVWGGAKIEKDWFYNLCDETGILVWQEFPLSSSGLDNYPPESAAEIQTMSTIARSYVQQLRHHASLLMWCGGNELYEFGDKAIVTDKHTMIRCIKDVVLAEDPGRRFVPGSPSGINLMGGWDSFGKGINWDTHGPWALPFTEKDKTWTAVENYWKLDDSLMHSEVGVAGAASADIIIKYKGEYDPMPPSHDNPLWNQCGAWVEWDSYLEEHHGKPASSLQEYVAWSQDRQSHGLTIALSACKNRFPSCGGFIIWMGHDSFPCTANTSIIDFDGNPKPAALALSKIWKNHPENK